MLDIKFIRENPEVVQKAAKDKRIDVDINHLLEIDSKYRELSISVQKLREERNKFSKEQNIKEGKRVKNELEIREHALKSVEQELNEWLLKVPNPAKDDVKVGKDESKNELVRKQGAIPTHMFKTRDHLELGELLDIIDVKRAAKVSGTRFTYLKNEGALLEFALIRLALDVFINEKFIPIIPPVLVTPTIMRNLGYMEHGQHEDYYLVLGREEEKKELEKFKRMQEEIERKSGGNQRATILQGEDYYLVGTAEHAIVPMHKDEMFNKKDLPKRYVAFSSAFRREAGSYGKDTRGILRVHQFDKVEMVSFTTEENDDKEHEYLLSLEEKLFQLLEIPYQVVKMCTGDLGFPAARKYDLEAWIPSQNKYREVTSTSTTTDFQARRLNIKYQDSAKQNEKKFVHILNGTAFAIGRTIIAILENYQQEDGSIVVPEALRKYIGKSLIKSKE